MKTHTSYEKMIQRERRKREQNLLQSPLNWFSLVGLYPLQTGENRLGHGSGYTIHIPELAQGAEALITLTGDEIWVEVGSHFTINGAPAAERQLRTDNDENPDLLECASLAMRVIQRGRLYFLRVWDRDSQRLKSFHGLNYFAVNPAWRVSAEFIFFDPPRETIVHTAVGSEMRVSIPGSARFQMSGVNCTLLGQAEGDELLFSFTDLTRQDATYPGGRYLVTRRPVHNRLILDFNLAWNWPCAYTAYATCPLPPPENHLAMRVEAGEKRYHDE
ncbi:MAG TPA: DUF1684 domain-containing protein [Anaerolineaceae bacterium]|jgi:hypothetical protein|nr:DUF1684 domain-containing protein [Anaerolineaceae bacterium]HNW14458.1 DUF1684 domain-containing protein [Anaerolineaceae bacterium]HOE02020.1 DUF1684 domain-containing protein [Anaerolineaceae bacterium]HOQ69208.1 DUF1684 domain-containing protein [Anaerolineaceae bacterium]HOS53245.1 DUF1684 domain-containing protein [Anaerolineaceae bacterium]